VASLSNRITDMLGIEYPILLAGMSPVAEWELAAAVSEAGGLGVLGAAAMTPDEISESVRKIREYTSKPFGVDILLPSATATLADLARESRDGGDPDAKPQLPREYVGFQQRVYEAFDLQDPGPSDPPRDEQWARLSAAERQNAQVDCILQENVPVFASGLGNPAQYVEAFHGNGTKVIGLVGNVKNARRIRDGGADIVVAQGTEAGGHTGRIGTIALVPQVVDAVTPLPVVAAGGIADGRGLAAALALGAEGVWCGTVFLATKEAHLDQELKERVIEAVDEDTIITRFYSGKTMRNIKNPLIDLWEQSNLHALPMGAQGAIAEPTQRAARKAGRIDLIRNAGGQAAGLVTEQLAAADVVRAIARQAEEILDRLPSGALTR
jgi:NAD(P)H-dependent flavin oxidoreductase YrpB (nitropropane dioxygenase family)